jgi:hypothetical protein
MDFLVDGVGLDIGGILQLLTDTYWDVSGGFGLSTSWWQRHIIGGIRRRSVMTRNGDG